MLESSQKTQILCSSSLFGKRSSLKSQKFKRKCRRFRYQVSCAALDAKSGFLGMSPCVHKSRSCTEPLRAHRRIGVVSIFEQPFRRRIPFCIYRRCRRSRGLFSCVDADCCTSCNFVHRYGSNICCGCPPASDFVFLPFRCRICFSSIAWTSGRSR